MKARDFATYTQFHLRGLLGKSDYLRKETFEYIHFGQEGFSMGFGNHKRQYSAMDGSAGTFYSRMLILPDSDLAISILTNAGAGQSDMKGIEWLTNQLLA